MCFRGENEVVPKVVEAILGLPENTHAAVRFTSVLLLGELCEWIEKHPTSLEPILNFLLYSLQQQGIASAAATSLQNICGTCNEHMAKHMPVLIQLLHRVDTFAITNNAVIGILKGVAAVVSCMPYAELTAALREVCLLQVKPLCQLMEGDTIVIRGTKSDPVMWLDRLAAVFRNLNVKPTEQGHPCRDVVTEVWPVLSSTFNKYQSDLRIMEKCGRCVRFTLRCLKLYARHILEPLVQQLVVLYRLHKHSCFLYLGSVLVDEYASEEDCIQGLLGMLQSFIEPTILLIQEENGLRNHPDTVDDFFRLCARFLQKSPVALIECSSLPSILQCALLACSLDHKEAHVSVMKFFCDLIDCSRSSCCDLSDAAAAAKRKQLVRNVLHEFGQQLISNLLHASVFFLHTYMLPDVADVICKLMVFDRSAVGAWLENAIKNLPNQNCAGGVHATNQQMLDFHVSVTRYYFSVIFPSKQNDFEIILSCRSDSSESITHALKDFMRLYR